MKNNYKTVALIVAGGQGKRMGRPKQFLKIAGKPMLEWTSAPFEKCRAIDAIILVVAKEAIGQAKRLRSAKIIKIVAGGKERQDSVRHGLQALPAETEIVVIHDGARPAIDVKTIAAAVEKTEKCGAVIVAVPVKDTIKKVSGQGEKLIIKATLDRRLLWQAQTPQVFKKKIILAAYQRLKSKITDEAMAVERAGFPVAILTGTPKNIKVTTPDDLLLMAAILGTGGK